MTPEPRQKKATGRALRNLAKKAQVLSEELALAVVAASGIPTLQNVPCAQFQPNALECRMKSYDAIIAGGGLIGCAIAFELARHDLRVALFDSQEPGHEASWASAGILSPAPESPE